MDGDRSIAQRPDRAAIAPRVPAALPPLLRAALDSTESGLLVLDRQLRTQFVNARAADLLGLCHGTEAGGVPVLRLLAQSHVLDQPALQTLAAAITGIETNPRREILLPVPAPVGARTLRLDITPAGEQGFALVLTDITQTPGLEAWREAHAATDPVTGIPHRQQFLRLLHERLDAGPATGLAVLRLALRGFKPVNDAIGNAGGDALLRLAAARLAACLRGTDALGRYGTAEFAAMVECGPAPEGLVAMAERLTQMISRPYLIEGQIITVGAHVGLACAPEDGESADALMANAGLALAAAQAEARGEPCFFEPRLEAAARRRRALEADLGRALAAGEFELHYQPQIELGTGRVRVLEALLRWHSPNGPVPPNEFIPIAEQIGLIGPIGDWVLDQACRDAAAWPPAIAVAVNVSPLQFESPFFIRAVARALERSGLPGDRLELEITENLLLRGQESVDAAFAALRELGVRLVLDDFGTGYAALSQLVRFRFDKIKIDRSFISAPGITAEHAAIVRAIAGLGASLHLATTAEGVETASQLAELSDNGCTQVQGYYFSKPVPAAEIPFLLQRLQGEAVAAE